ncbi:MAG: heavy metal translocating P-type ATPase metal-binding domain-containing protein [Chthoniobacterales bacterium]
MQTNPRPARFVKKRVDTIPCKHCGTHFHPEADESFCCPGCAFVYQTIQENDFGQYYDIKGSHRGIPLKSIPLEKRDFAWLEEEQKKAEEKDSVSANVSLGVQGITCSGCVWLLEKLFMQQPGAIRAHVRAHPGSIELSWEAGKFSLVEFADQARRYGYLLGLQQAEQVTESRRLRARLGVCAALAMNAMAFSLPRYLGMAANDELANFFTLAAAVSATLAMLVGGSWFFTRALGCLRTGVLHMDLPIALGLSGAWIGSIFGWFTRDESLLYFDFVAIFIFLMLAGRLLQTKAVERNRNRLLQHDPSSRQIRTADGTFIDREKITRGIQLSLISGQVLPVLSRNLGEPISISVASITGEADPIQVEKGGRIPSGACYLGSEEVRVETLEDWSESLYQKLVAPEESASTHPFLDRVLRFIIAAVLLLAVLGGAWHWWHDGFAAALQVFVSVLVVSCPCALGVALPLADDLAAARMESMGVFMRRAVFWPRFKAVKKIIFDKTGTLTLETPALLHPQELAKLTSEEEKMLSTLVAASHHPLSRSLLEHLAGRGAFKIYPDLRVEEKTGCGVLLKSENGDCWALGKSGWQADSSSGGTVFSKNGSTLAEFHFGDMTRPMAQKEIAALQEQYKVYLLSGDRKDKVLALAQELDVPADQIVGEANPQQKEDFVKAWDKRDTLYLGDGANDSLAFQAAWCTGTPVADKGLLEKRADFFFLQRSLHWLQGLTQTRAMREFAVRTTVLFTLLYNVTVVTMSLWGDMTPLLAAILMPLSSLTTLGIVAGLMKSR